MLLIEISPLGLLIPHSFIQLNFKSKYCYFLRRETVQVTNDNCSVVLVTGEMTPRSFDDLAAVVEEVS